MCRWVSRSSTNVLGGKFLQREGFATGDILPPPSSTASQTVTPPPLTNTSVIVDPNLAVTPPPLLNASALALNPPNLTLPNPVINVNLTPQPRIVLYYTEWCRFSKDFLTEWTKLEQLLLGTQIKVEKVDADLQPELARAVNVTEFPTVILFKDGKQTVYAGSRDAASVSRFIELS